MIPFPTTGAPPTLDACTPDTAPRPASDAASRAKVEAAAEKFEALFINEMLRQMRRTTRELAAEDSVYRSRASEDMLDFADTTVADALAAQRAFGIADAILRQLLPDTAPAATGEVRRAVSAGAAAAGDPAI